MTERQQIEDLTISGLIDKDTGLCTTKKDLIGPYLARKAFKKEIKRQRLEQEMRKQQTQENQDDGFVLVEPSDLEQQKQPPPVSKETLLEIVQKGSVAFLDASGNLILRYFNPNSEKSISEVLRL